MITELRNNLLMMQSEFSNSIEESFKDLLEDKHLYQYSMIVYPPFDVIYNKLLLKFPAIENGIPLVKSNCKRIFDYAPRIMWEILATNQVPRQPFGSNIPHNMPLSIEFTPPTIKVFCSICKRIEPYNFYYGVDISKDFNDNSERDLIDNQIFSLAYECQSCKGLPEVFLVRREKMKIMLSGRTPIEEVDVPKYIPKAQRLYFSDAVIAYYSGQILAGKFLLRTLIEQYIRDFTENKTSQIIDKLFEEYNESLPDDFNSRFPSLAKIYNQLSVDIHSANPNTESFIRAREDIQEHFEAKKIYKIPEKLRSTLATNN